MGLVPIEEEEETPEVSLSVIHTENVATANQEADSLQEPNLPVS